MMTTRIMLSRAFEDMQEEKRQLRANYRQDMADIESRQERVMDRMERLDAGDKDLIDVEGVMSSLAETAQKLSELIPDIPADLLLNKTAEKMAALEPKILPAEEPVSLVAEEMKKDPIVLHRPKPNTKEIMATIKEILKEVGPLRIRGIEHELKTRYGWEWKAFGASFSKWRVDHPNMVEKNGLVYTAID